MTPLNHSSVYKKYPGKWVAFARDRKTVVASGLRAKTTLEKAQKSGTQKPILFRVPKKAAPFVGGIL